MDIKNLVKEEDRKKFLIIALVVFFIIIGAVIFLITRPNTPPVDNTQLLSDLQSLTPPDSASTRTLEKLPIIELHTDKTELAPGQSATISWAASNAVNCVDRNGDTLDLSGTLSISPNEPYTFDISCTGPNGTEIQSVTIAVTSAPIINLSASPSSVFSGGTSVISWDTTNADRCTSDNGNTLRLSDNLSVSPKSSYTFSMSCVGEKGTTKKSITVAIKERPLAIDTTPSGGTSGGTDVTTTIPTGVTPARTIGSFFSNIPSSLGGFFSGTPSGTNRTTSATTSTTPEITLTASPETISYDSTTLIRWTIANATYCLFKSTSTSTDPLGNNIPPVVYSSGSRTTPKLTATQTYTLSCSKNAGITKKSVTVTVGERPIPGAPVFTTQLKVTTGDNPGESEQFLDTHKTLTFSWKAENATTCELKKDGVVIAGKTALGANTTTPAPMGAIAGKFVYTLTCTGESGEVTSDPITVHVVNCAIKEGTLGPSELTTKRGTVERESRSGYPDGAICTWTYGDPERGTYQEFAEIWGFRKGVIDMSKYPIIARHYGFPYENNPEGNLCSWTSYTSYKSSDGVTRNFVSPPSSGALSGANWGGLNDYYPTPGRFFGNGSTNPNNLNGPLDWDKGEHKDWVYMPGSTKIETYGATPCTSQGDHYDAQEHLVAWKEGWIGTNRLDWFYGFGGGDRGGPQGGPGCVAFFGDEPGWTVYAVTSIKCVVSTSDPQAAAIAKNALDDAAARARAQNLEICLTTQTVPTTTNELVQTCITRAPSPTWSDPFRTVCIAYGMVMQPVTHPAAETVATCNTKYGPL